MPLPEKVHVPQRRARISDELHKANLPLRLLKPALHGLQATLRTDGAPPPRYLVVAARLFAGRDVDVECLQPRRRLEEEARPRDAQDDGTSAISSRRRLDSSGGEGKPW